MTELNDKRSDGEFLRSVLSGVSPLSVLQSVSHTLTQYPDPDPKRRVWADVSMSFMPGYPSDAKDAMLNAQADERQRMLEANPLFVASLERLKRAGVKLRWRYTSEYSYAARLLTLEVPLKVLPRLEAMAARDAGIISSEEQSRAAEVYHRWLLQNYHPDWKTYQERWPAAETPYNTERNSFGKNPNPLARGETVNDETAGCLSFWFQR